MLMTIIEAEDFGGREFFDGEILEKTIEKTDFSRAHALFCRNSVA